MGLVAYDNTRVLFSSDESSMTNSMRTSASEFGNFMVVVVTDVVRGMKIVVSPPHYTC